MSLEDYPATTKKLASSVQRLRGWVGSDSTKQVELANSLVLLTEERLTAGAWTDAIADAQESVGLAGRILAAHGALGPYTPAVDAERFITAAVHFADAQTRLGLTVPAGHTVATAERMIEQLPHLDLAIRPRTRVRALLARAGAAKAAGDLSGAVRAIDATIALAAPDAPGSEDVPPLLLVNVLRRVAECRDAEGRTDESVAWALTAVHRYRETADLSQPSRINPARLERLAAPLQETYQMAARVLLDAGDAHWAIALDREATAQLQPLTSRVHTAHIWLGRAEAALASDLLRVGRPMEALDAARTGATRANDDDIHVVLARTLLAVGDAASAIVELEPIVERGLANELVTSTDIEALAVLAEAWEADGRDAGQLRAALAQARESLPTEIGELPDWSADSPFAAGADAGMAARWTREVLAAFADEASRMRFHTTDREKAIAEAAAEKHAAERAAKQERRRLAAQKEADRQAAAEADRVAAAERAAEHRRVMEEAERVERKRRRQERIEQHRRDTERSELDRLVAELKTTLADTTDTDERDRIELRLAESRLALTALDEQDRLAAESAAGHTGEVPVEPETPGRKGHAGKDGGRHREPAGHAVQGTLDHGDADPIASTGPVPDFDESGAVGDVSGSVAEGSTPISGEPTSPTGKPTADAGEHSPSAISQASPTRELAPGAAEPGPRDKEQALPTAPGPAGGEPARPDGEASPDKPKAVGEPALESASDTASQSQLEPVEPIRPAGGSDSLPGDSATGGGVVATRDARDRARDAGDRKALRQATESLADALRPLATEDPAQWGAEFVTVLQELASLRLRTGDWWGSRGPASEAKKFAKEWGLR